MRERGDPHGTERAHERSMQCISDPHAKTDTQAKHTGMGHANCRSSQQTGNQSATRGLTPPSP